MNLKSEDLLSCCRDRPIRGSKHLHKERDSLEIWGEGSLSREKRNGCVVDGGVHAVDQCSSTQPVDCFVQVIFQMYRICMKNLVLELLM